MFKAGYGITSTMLIVAWIFTNVSSYTLALNITKLSGNLYFNYLLGCLLYIPSAIFCYFTMDRYGRRPIFSMSLILTGTCCLVMAFTPKENSGVILAFYLMGKMCVGLAFTFVWLVTIELYPTNLRSQALGICSTISRASIYQRC
jgi:OCT family organic cation transporter-like MFS transporter 4/5